MRKLLAPFVFLGFVSAGIALSAFFAAMTPIHAQAPNTPAQQANKQGVPSAKQIPGRTGLPLPRFVSFRAAEVNLRTGPGVRYPIDWVYKRRGFPVQIIDEFETWRRVRDWQGTTGWVHQSMVQGKRTLLVTGGHRLLRQSPSEGSGGIAYLEEGVIANLGDCQDSWCRVKVNGHAGWLKTSEFFGVQVD